MGHGSLPSLLAQAEHPVEKLFAGLVPEVAWHGSSLDVPGQFVPLVSGMSTTELARRLGLSDTSVGKKLRGEVATSATELVKITWLFKIEFTEYFFVGLGDLPESTRPQRKDKR